MDIQSLLSITGSKTKAQEIILLLHNTKPVVRQGYYETELPALQQFCSEQDIFLVKSKFKVLLADAESTAAYSNKGVRIPESDPRPGMYFVYLSKDEHRAWLASYKELTENHQELGLLLGYPECCVRSFCQNFTESHPNLELKPTNPYTNLTQRNQDCVILSHFPCRSECGESIILAKQYLDVLQTVDASRTAEMLQQLQ